MVFDFEAELKYMYVGDLHQGHGVGAKKCEIVLSPILHSLERKIKLVFRPIPPDTVLDHLVL